MGRASHRVDVRFLKTQNRGSALKSAKQWKKKESPYISSVRCFLKHFEETCLKKLRFTLCTFLHFTLAEISSFVLCLSLPAMPHMGTSLYNRPTWAPPVKRKPSVLSKCSHCMCTYLHETSSFTANEISDKSDKTDQQSPAEPGADVSKKESVGRPCLWCRAS